VVSALSFRILHGSRELALALIESTQQLGVIREMLQVVAVPRVPDEHPGAPPFKPGPGGIRLRNVSFSYPDGTQVLRRLDLDIAPGQRVGIVGPSGSGKTTLLGLVQRLQDVQGGEVLIDGQNVAHVTLDSLRRAIAVVPQEISLLHRTMRENLVYGRPEAPEDQLRQAARAAYCEEFIRELPQGYDTVVGERGARLSGGQRQRVGIARAMLKNAPILLLDEATSALDSASERKIQLALDRLIRGRTVIAVAHRLSTVATFDRVLVLVDGEIVEDGTPDRLRHAGGLYQRLWAAQARGQETA
jgi:ATP-binding cassette subfamily B protein